MLGIVVSVMDSIKHILLIEIMVFMFIDIAIEKGKKTINHVFVGVLMPKSKSRPEIWKVYEVKNGKIIRHLGNLRACNSANANFKAMEKFDMTGKSFHTHKKGIKCFCGVTNAEK